MRKALLIKEFRLTAHPTTYIFLCFGAMTLIPAYPYYIAWLYVCLGIFFSFLKGREERDLDYSALLPVAKRDIVRAKCLFCVLIQLASLIIAVPFALLSARINRSGNPVGVDANVAYFGLSLVLFGIFDRIFLPGYFRTGHKLGRPLAAALTVGSLYVLVAEVAVHLPLIGPYLDGTEHVWRQWPVLAVGAGAYALLVLRTVRRCAALFETVDL